MPRLVIAIGGNSLIPDGDHESVQDQYFAAAETDDHIASLVQQGWDVAISHGNGMRPGRRVFLRCYAGPDAGILVAVRDEGPGFDPTGVPDPRSADRMHLTHGRGLLLMRELMDRLEYRRGGSEVVLFQKLSDDATQTP